MAEYIERSAAIKAAKHAWAKGLEPSQYIEALPAADVAPVVHGRWIHDGRRIECGIDWCHCSECGKSDNFCARTNYCPVCGAKMDGERKDGGAE